MVACDRQSPLPPRPTSVTSSTSSTTTTSSSTSTTSTTTARAASYHFPVSGAARVSYAHTHAAYPATDVFAPCGSTLVAITDGRVDEVTRVDRWDPAHDDGALRGGLSVSIVGDDGVRYYTSHFQDVAPALQAGDRVVGGQEIGHVGHTGNARGKPCHTHFGISPPRGPGDWEVRRGVVWPWPYLDSWRSGGQRSPVAEVRAWAAAHPR